MEFEVSSTVPVQYGKFIAAIQNAKLKPTARTGYNFMCEFGTVVIVENSLNNTLKIDAVTTAHLTMSLTLAKSRNRKYL